MAEVEFQLIADFFGGVLKALCLQQPPLLAPPPAPFRGAPGIPLLL